MAEPNSSNPMPKWLDKGLGMLFGTKPKQALGMAPPPTAAATPQEPTLPSIFTPQPPPKVEKALRDAGVDN